MDTFETLGKAGALQKLYEGTPFRPCINTWFENNGAHSISCSRLLLEGMDFDLSFVPFKHLGYKAVVLATGELFSCMAEPRTLSLNIGVSAKLDYKEVAQLWEGVILGAKQFGYKEVALDLGASLTGLAIAVNASGSSSKEMAAGRPIAKSMDLICVSGNPGASFIGEQILHKGKNMEKKDRDELLEKYKQLIGAYLKPELSPYVLQAFNDSGIIPSFGYFCRESLSNTIKTLCRESGLGAKIYVDKLPFASGSIDAADFLKLDPVQAALKGGEDNFLLFTIPIGSHEKFRRDFQAWDVIGHLARPEVGTTLVSPDGLEHSF